MNELTKGWECNECGSQEYSGNLSGEEVHELGCGNCGSSEFHLTDVMNWQHMIPPYLWKKHGLTVVGDRHLPNGDRQHIVLGSIPLGTVIDNAQIFGQDDIPNAVYDDLR